MSHYFPQTDNPDGFSVLLIDTHASIPALLVCADQRIRAAKKLLQCLSLMSGNSSHPQFVKPRRCSCRRAVICLGF